MTSKRICEISSGKTYVFYRAECSCGSDNHSHVIEISQDPFDTKHSILEMTFYSTQVDKDWWKLPDKNHRFALSNMWWAFKRRIKCAFNILFFGYFETEVNFMFHGEDQIQDYINALNEGIERVKIGVKEANEKHQKQPKESILKD